MSSIFEKRLENMSTAELSSLMAGDLIVAIGDGGFRDRVTHWALILCCALSEKRELLKGKPRKQVLIDVRGGVATVNKCPPDVTVKIIDWDN